MEGLKLADLVNEEILKGGSFDKADKAVKDFDLFEGGLLSKPTIHYYTLDSALACHPGITPDRINDLKAGIASKYDSCCVNVSCDAKTPSESYLENVKSGDIAKRLAIERENKKDNQFFNYYNPFRKMHGTGKKSRGWMFAYDFAMLSLMSGAAEHAVQRDRYGGIILLTGLAFFIDRKRRDAVRTAETKIKALEKGTVPYENFHENLKNAEVVVHYSNRVTKRLDDMKENFANQGYYMIDYNKINMTLMALHNPLLTEMREWH